MKKLPVDHILRSLGREGDPGLPFDRGHILINQGQDLDHILLLLEGYVEITQYSPGGRKNIATFLNGPQLLGLVEFLNGEALIFSQVRALSPGTLIPLSLKETKALLGDPSLSPYLMAYLASLTQEAILARFKDRLMEKKVRLLDFFFQTALHGGLPCEISLSKEDISVLLQIPPRTLYRYLREAEEEGYIVRQGQGIWIYPEHFSRLKAQLDLSL